MKPRILKTYPILAVAFTAAACTGSTPPDARPAAREPAAMGEGQRPAAVGGEPVAANPEEPGSVVLAAFRPPTDADGYPLVGNLIRKGDSEGRPDAGADGGHRGEGRR